MGLIPIPICGSGAVNQRIAALISARGLAALSHSLRMLGIWPICRQRNGEGDLRIHAHIVRKRGAGLPRISRLPEPSVGLAIAIHVGGGEVVILMLSQRR